jgi:hypothetical protein
VVVLVVQLNAPAKPKLLHALRRGAVRICGSLAAAVRYSGSGPAAAGRGVRASGAAGLTLLGSAAVASAGCSAWLGPALGALVWQPLLRVCSASCRSGYQRSTGNHWSSDFEWEGAIRPGVQGRKLSSGSLRDEGATPVSCHERRSNRPAGKVPAVMLEIIARAQPC